MGRDKRSKKIDFWIKNVSVDKKRNLQSENIHNLYT